MARRALVACFVMAGCHQPEPRLTPGAIAVENLEHELELAERRGRVRLDLLRAQAHFLGDTSALDRLAALGDLASVHRFREALEAGSERAPILVAMGRADEVIAELEANAKAGPAYETLVALAAAQAALGRFDEAERSYLDAIARLETTSPFPFAFVHFARGVMWSERAGDPLRAAALYAKALELLPQYVPASVHLAELEAERGDLKGAIERLRPIAERAEDPEVLAVLGELYPRMGAAERGHAAVELAKARYEALLAKHPPAFADHAAELYLGAAADPDRAYALALTNLESRETERSLSLAIRAARASGRRDVACVLVARAKAKRRTGVELQGLLEGC